MICDAIVPDQPSRPGTRAPSLGPGPVLFVLDLLAAALFWPFILAVSLAPGAGPALPGLLAYPALWLLFLYALGFYRREAMLEPRRMLARLPLAALLSTPPAALAGLLLPTGEGAGTVLFADALLGLTAAGAASRGAFAGLRGLGIFRRRVLVIGAGRRAWDLAWLLRQEGRAGAYDLAFAHHPQMGELDPRLAADPAAPVWPASSGFLALARGIGADQVVVAPDERRGLDMKALLDCRTAGFPVVQYLGFLEREIGRVDVKRLELGWLLYADGFGAGLLDQALKRLLDIVASLVLLLLTAPLLLAAALAVRLEDGAPVLYRQNRVTKDGQVFRILKLRTMRVDAERQGAAWAAKGDPRVTRIGRFLRRTRLDELPQLVNVLRGDMSFVGPRPERPEFIRELAAQLPLYEERHRVRAGLTGWAQVNYPYGASLDDARSKLSYDLYYVKNASVLLDLRIILQTLRVVLFPGGGAR